MPLKILLVFGV